MQLGQFKSNKPIDQSYYISPNLVSLVLNQLSCPQDYVRNLTRIIGIHL